MEDQTQLEAEPQGSVAQNPTSSMARPPGEAEDMQAALKSLRAFHSAMGQKTQAVEPEEKPVVEEKPAVEAPKVEEKPTPQAAPPVDVSRFENELAQLKAELAKRDDLARKAKLNPIEFLKENGVTLEQVTDWLQNGDESKAAAELKAKAVEQELAEYRAREQKSKEEQDKAAAETARQQAGIRYRDEVIKPAVTADKYPASFAVHGEELHDVLLSLAIDVFRRTGNEPSVESLAKSVEDKLAAVKKKLMGDAQAPAKKDPPPPSLKSLQSSTQVPTGTKHEESDDDEAFAAAVSKLTKLRQGK